GSRRRRPHHPAAGTDQHSLDANLIVEIAPTPPEPSPDYACATPTFDFAEMSRLPAHAQALIRSLFVASPIRARLHNRRLVRTSAGSPGPVQSLVPGRSVVLQLTRGVERMQIRIGKCPPLHPAPLACARAVPAGMWPGGGPLWRLSPATSSEAKEGDVATSS